MVIVPLRRVTIIAPAVHTQEQWLDAAAAKGIAIADGFANQGDGLQQTETAALDLEAVRACYHVALAIRQEIRAMPTTRGDVGRISTDDAGALIPEGLDMMLRMLLTGELQEGDADGGKGDRVSARALSIGQDVVAAVSTNRIIPPSHVGLALTLHQKTRSKKLIQLFHDAGHCMSYERVQQVNITASCRFVTVGRAIACMHTSTTIKLCLSHAAESVVAARC